MPRVFALGVSGAHSYQLVLWLERLADWFGYRYMSFDAGRTGAGWQSVAGRVRLGQ